MDPERALQAAMISRLRAEPALTAALGGTRVYDEPPEDPVYPYVAVGRMESRPLKADGGGLEHRVTLTCVSRFGGVEEAKAAVGAARLSLDDAFLDLEGHRLVSLQATYSDVFRASDFRTVFGVLRFRAVTEAH